jgi:phage/plasmid-associated DNA primase
MNKRPRNTDLDRAMQRRLLFITFRAAVDVRDMDRELGRKLEAEYSGIRNWRIEGYRKFVADGCNFVHSSDMSDDMVSYYVENGKTLLVFMDKMGYRAYCRVGHLDEVPKYVSRNDLYQRYKNWCERFGYDYDLDNKFGRELTRMGVGRKRTQYGVYYKIYSDEDIDYAIRL